MKYNKLSDIHALWVGNKLSKIAQCCLKSFLMRGHKVFLHTYTEIEGLPDGVIRLNAEEVISEEKIFKHKGSDSYALFSDVFRYQLLHKFKGIYVDCDVYCIKPIHIPKTGYLLGYEDDNKINGAILALPNNSALLNKLIDAAYNPSFIPPWYGKKQKYYMKIRKTLGLSMHISDMPWGVIGPDAITFFVKKIGLLKEIQPLDIFYPVHYSCVSQFIDNELTINDITTTRTQCVHLFNEMLKKIDLENIDTNCILSKMLRNEI